MASFKYYSYSMSFMRRYLTRVFRLTGRATGVQQANQRTVTSAPVNINVRDVGPPADYSVDSVRDLQQLVPSDNETAIVRGYYVGGDWLVGDMIFRFVYGSLVPHNYGTVIQDAAGRGRWFLDYSGLGELSVLQFGVVRNQDQATFGWSGWLESNHVRMQHCLDASVDTGLKVVFMPAGNYWVRAQCFYLTPGVIGRNFSGVRIYGAGVAKKTVQINGRWGWNNTELFNINVVDEEASGITIIKSSPNTASMPGNRRSAMIAVDRDYNGSGENRGTFNGSIRFDNFVIHGNRGNTSIGSQRGLSIAIRGNISGNNQVFVNDLISCHTNSSPLEIDSDNCDLRRILTHHGGNHGIQGEVSAYKSDRLYSIVEDIESYYNDSNGINILNEGQNKVRGRNWRFEHNSSSGFKTTALDLILLHAVCNHNQARGVWTQTEAHGGPGDLWIHNIHVEANGTEGFNISADSKLDKHRFGKIVSINNGLAGTADQLGWIRDCDCDMLILKNHQTVTPIVTRVWAKGHIAHLIGINNNSQIETRGDNPAFLHGYINHTAEDGIYARSTAQVSHINTNRLIVLRGGHSGHIATNTITGTGGISGSWTNIPVNLSTPSLSNPGVNATGISKKPNFGWGAVANTQYYVFLISTSTNFAEDVIFARKTYTNSFNMDGDWTETELRPNTTYYWKVYASNGTSGVSNWSVVRSFVTGA